MSLPKGTSMSEDVCSGSASTISEPPIRKEWLGTSQVSIQQNLALQKAGKLDLLISQRKALVEECTVLPYDPTILLTLAFLDCQLGFTDVAASNAYRAHLLVQAATSCREDNQSSKLGYAVLKAVSLRLYTSSSDEVLGELRLLQLQVYQTLLMGLLGCGAFWDGLKFASEALKVYPGDVGLKDLKDVLKAGFLRRNEALKGVDASHQDRIEFTRSGNIVYKQYPWLDHNLFKRTTATVQEINKSFTKSNCEVKTVFFGPNSDTTSTIPPEDEDVGSLGIFATQDIKEGETLMVDRTILGISDVPSSRLLHCDACHASLSIPYLRPENIITPKCCTAVAYCSNACHDVAIKGYHTVLCGKDFDWLYADINNTAKTKVWSRWRAILFLRVMAVFISGFNILTPDPSDQQQQNPLSHPILARLTASYPAPSTPDHTSTNEWQFFENIEAPTRILRQLGIDIFTSPAYTPEIIQTILSRLENNANQSKTALIPGSPPVHMVCINPKYVFFNHSCDPNVSWHGAVPSGDMDVKWLRGDSEAESGGGWMRPGESAVICRAGAAIRRGEECRISYVGDPLGIQSEEGERMDSDGKLELGEKSKEGGKAGDGEEEKTPGGGGRAEKRLALEKWCEGGCGCRVCEAENLTRAKAEAEAEAEQKVDPEIGRIFGDMHLDEVLS